jgi:hypothetical protein
MLAAVPLVLGLRGEQILLQGIVNAVDEGTIVNTQTLLKNIPRVASVLEGMLSDVLAES